MVAAYLRRPDLILPDYPNGLKSKIRESVLLEVIDCEMNAEVYHRLAWFNSTLLPILTNKAKDDAIQKCTEYLTVAQHYREYDRRKAVSALASEARKSAIEVYEMLNKYEQWRDQPDFTPTQFRAIIQRIQELKEKAREKES